MFARKGLFSSIGRTTALATVAALALTAVAPSQATAAGPAKKEGLTAAGASDATDFSARRRHYRGGGGAAAAAAFAGIVGTGIAIAAANSRRDYYDSYGYYGGGPVYYRESYGPGYYGGGPYYGYRGYRSGTPYYQGHPLASW